MNKDAFFTHLKRKAHFFMLPKPIVTFAMESSLVSITATVPERPRPAARRTPRPYQARRRGGLPHIDRPNVSPTVEIRIPIAADALAQVGRGLGAAFDQREYAVLDVGYHEMTHAWLYLQAFAAATSSSSTPTAWPPTRTPKLRVARSSIRTMRSWRRRGTTQRIEYSGG